MAYCADCGIRFLTHPRNAGRRDLRCPFGCRDHHRRASSGRRSTAYYRTAAGKQKKRSLNARRGQPAAAVAVAVATGPVADGARPPDAPGSSAHSGEPRAALASAALPAAEPDPAGAIPLKLKLLLSGVELDETSVLRSRLLPYVRVLVGLIEGVAVSIGELRELLRRALRQRSIATRRRCDYVVAYLHQHPP